MSLFFYLYLSCNFGIENFFPWKIVAVFHSCRKYFLRDLEEIAAWLFAYTHCKTYEQPLKKLFTQNEAQDSPFTSRTDTICMTLIWFCTESTILGFHTIPRDTKDNRHSGHVGVPNIRNNQNSFVKSTPTWPPWHQVKTGNMFWMIIITSHNFWTSNRERNTWLIAWPV